MDEAKHELMSSSLRRKSIAEAIGTFLIVFAGCGSIMVAHRFPGSVSPTAIPLIFGMTVATMIYSLGHVSGAHFNPAVTLAFSVTRHFPIREVFAYWLAQFVGAFFAIALLHFLLPLGTAYGATIPAVPNYQAVGWEIILTFCLMFVIISVATDTRAVGTMAGAAIGAAVMIGAFIGGPVTGASMNPARSFAPALFQSEWNHLWIYFVGPVIGAVLASVTYQWIRCASDENNQSDSLNRKDAKGCC